MSEFVFFYGTLMTGFARRPRLRIDDKMTYVGRGAIGASLFDLGIYPAAVPSSDDVVWGELFEVREAEAVLSALDEIEGYRPGDPDRSLYIREAATVRLAGGREVTAWVYFYNAPLGQAPRIRSGDYLEHVRAR